MIDAKNQALKASIFICMVVLLFGLTADQAAAFDLQVLHASDLEGGVDAIDDAPNFTAIVEKLEQEAADAGIESIVVSAGDNYIPGPFFSAAGDFSLRQPLRAVLGNPDAREGVGRVDISIMNIIGFDASALGNHEFDPGTSILGDIIGTDIRDSNDDGVLDQPRWLGANFPYLSSNLDFSGDGNLSGLFTDTILPSTAFVSPISDLDAAAATPKISTATVIERNGELIGVVGATTPLLESISSPGDTSVKDPGSGTNDMAALASILQPVIDDVIDGGDNILGTGDDVDKVILTTHLQQISLEQDLITRLRGVDIVIAGGSDTILADSSDRLRSGDVAAGPYPIVAINADGDPAVVVSTDGQYKYVGRLVVTFDGNGVLDTVSIDTAVSGPYPTDDQGVEDVWGSLDPFQPGTKGAKVAELTEAVNDVVIAKDGNVFGDTDVYLEGRRAKVRTEETNLGSLTADANLATARTYDRTVWVSIKNGGGIRAEIGNIDGITGEFLPPQANPTSGKMEGEVSQLDIENSLKFNNGLTLITLTALQLKQVVEHAVAASEPGATPGRFPQIGGMAFSFDPAREPGDRVRSLVVLVRDDDDVEKITIVKKGRVLRPNRAIRIVTLDFLAGGGDSYPYPGFVAADPTFANRVDLKEVLFDPGMATFTDSGSEQDALAEFLKKLPKPFNQPEVGPEDDKRIQNTSFRKDTVLKDEDDEDDDEDDEDDDEDDEDDDEKDDEEDDD